MGYDDKSILKSKLIDNVLLKKKSYTFQDFKFKVIEMPKNYFNNDSLIIELYNFENMILRLLVSEYPNNKFTFKVTHFNPQTNNDCASINHVIARFGDHYPENAQHKDRGNASVLCNQYVFRKRSTFYSFTRVWTRGEITDDNFNKELSHEFSTNEYINHVKKLWGFKKVQRRGIKAKIKRVLESEFSKEKKRLLVDSLKTEERRY